MFLIDLHVHTRRFSPCAELLDPNQLPPCIRSKGIHGVVLAEHDALWGAADIRVLNRDLNDRRIYRGVEVSTDKGHVVVVGLNDLSGIRPGIAMEALVAITRRNHAAAIVVHPQQPYGGGVVPLGFSQLPHQINAVEVASSTTRGQLRGLIHQRIQQYGWHAVAGSDAHCLEQVGCCATGFDQLPCDEHELAHLIRTGRGVALSLEDGTPSLINHAA
jgi:predicted metal-dependent phosphoesterase TrpH